MWPLISTAFFTIIL